MHFLNFLKLYYVIQKKKKKKKDNNIYIKYINYIFLLFI